jgi:prepilin-type N-terminal cleavage/methylation domain-containing protein
LRKGYTLIEVIIAVAIFVAIGVIVWTIGSTATRYSKETSVKSVTDLIAQQLLRKYELEGSFPSSADEFKKFLEDTRYFNTVPQNALWYGNPEDGWTWNSSTRVLSALKYNNDVFYSVTVQVPSVAPSNPYSRPSTYGGDK